MREKREGRYPAGAKRRGGLGHARGKRPPKRKSTNSISKAITSILKEKRLQANSKFRVCLQSEPP